MTRLALLGLLLWAAPVSVPVSALAQTPRSWTAEKCARHGAAWTEALSRFGEQGLSAGFLAAHDAFLASGCQSRAAICPSSEADLALANALTIAAMNGGAASTFLPFRCPG